MSSQRGAPSSPDHRQSTPLFMPTSSPARPASSASLTPRMARLTTGAMSSIGASSPLFYGGTSSSVGGRRTPGPRSTASLSRSDLARGSATPRAHRRGDLGQQTNSGRSPFHRREVVLVRENQSGQLTSESHVVPPVGDEEDGQRVIWGTNVSIADSMRRFREFLLGFQRKHRLRADNIPFEEGEGEEYTYVDMLKTMRQTHLSSLNLSIPDLAAYPDSRNLAHQLPSYPAEIVPMMDSVVRDILVEWVLEDKGSDDELREVEETGWKVRPYGLDNGRGMRELGPGDIDKLVSVKGLVIRSTPIIPDMKTAFFRCGACNQTVNVELDRGRIAEPTQCPRPACQRRDMMELIHNRSDFEDKQIVRLQETPDVVPDGQTPHSVSICFYDELVDIAKPGDRIAVTGIFRSVPVRVNPRRRTIKALFKTYLDVTHIAKTDAKRLGIDTSTLDTELREQQAETDQARRVTQEERSRILEISTRSDVYDLLARSIAPSIWEMDDVKKGILLQLFGGTNKVFLKGGGPRYRGDINILLCGDPSTSKSQILQYVHKIAPRGVYTSGKGSSAVGLTAYITRDVDTKQLVLESGALVLSDGGICCIDEFDKMSDSTRSVLHEVMEQQTVSIAKAGIITTLNARTSILASANPIGSKYNPNLPIPQNIDLPPTLLSRFDLVYLILDKIDEATDRRLAQHLVGMYLEDRPQNASSADIIPIELLTAYISYAREIIKPSITEEAGETLIKQYVEMRKLGEDVRASEKRITATTRQLESMIRLSEAHAKMRFSELVEVSDVEEAARLIRSAIKEYATDPLTGKIDMELITTGLSTHQRRVRSDLRREVVRLVEQMTSGSNAPARIGDLLRTLNEQSNLTVSAEELGVVLESLVAEGGIAVAGTGNTRTVRKVLGATIS